MHSIQFEVKRIGLNHSLENIEWFFYANFAKKYNGDIILISQIK